MRTDRASTRPSSSAFRAARHAYNKGPSGGVGCPPTSRAATEYSPSQSDLLLLSACDGFVGKFTSNLARIAYALMAARAVRTTSDVSLDAFAPWGPALEIRRAWSWGLLSVGRGVHASNARRDPRQQERQEVPAADAAGGCMRGSAGCARHAERLTSRLCVSGSRSAAQERLGHRTGAGHCLGAVSVGRRLELLTASAGRSPVTSASIVRQPA